MAQPFSSEAAAIVRPWGLLTAIVLGYAAYTLHTGWQDRIPRPTPRIALPTVQLRMPPLEAPRTVIKCVQAGSVTYSDLPCDTLFDVLVLPTD